MSLNAAQKKQNSIELKENFRILGFDPEVIQADLGFSPKEFEDTINVGPVEDPTMVWMLRDYMEEKILQQGKEPYPCTILTHNIYFPYKKNWK